MDTLSETIAVDLDGMPAAVIFWASWCSRCKQIRPLLDELGEEYQGKVQLVGIDVDEHQSVAEKFRVLGIPTLLILKEGEVIQRYSGAKNPGFYRQVFQNLAADRVEDLPGHISRVDRFLRLGIGFLLVAWGGLSEAGIWLIPVGLLVGFTGLYDRCPVWKAVRSRIKNAFSE